MTSLELIFRFAALSQLILIAALTIKDHSDKVSGLLAVSWILSMISYQVVTLVYRDSDWGLWGVPFVVAAMGRPVLFWLFARSLFEDNFQFRRLHVLIVILVAGLSAAAFLGSSQIYFADVLRNLRIVGLPTVAFVFVALGVAAVLKDRRADLVNFRRKCRVLVLVVVGAYMILVTIVAIFQFEFYLGTGEEVPVWGLIHAGTVFAIALAANFFILIVHPEFLQPATRKPGTADIDPAYAEKVLLELTQLMEQGGIYREQGLTIGSLANRLGEKEYRLRRMINGRFGYRNFNEFLNRYRINDAADRLIDPETSHLPALTIALDVGYRSLGPFHRAFKEAYGLTPIEYRKKHIRSQDEQESR